MRPARSRRMLFCAIALLILGAQLRPQMVHAASGQVYTWGADWYSDLGYPGGGNRSAPTAVPGASAMGVVAGDMSSYFLPGDGSVWSWGRNLEGELGNGQTDNNAWPTPAKVVGLPAISQLNSRFRSVVAYGADGSAWGWGDNSSGQIGPGPSSVSTPMQIPGLTAPRALASGGSASYAVLADGTVRAWGNNYFNEVGDGTSTNRSTPTQVLTAAGPLTGITAVSGGLDDALALRNDGTVWAWGRNNDGQTGNGTVGGSSPVAGQVAGISGITQVLAASGTSYALGGGGRVYAWGLNDKGQVNPDQLTTGTPRQVARVTNAVQISAGGGVAATLGIDGVITIWGNNDSLEMGNGGGPQLTPAPMPGISGVSALSVGSDHVMAVTGGTVPPPPAVTPPPTPPTPPPPSTQPPSGGTAAVTVGPRGTSGGVGGSTVLTLPSAGTSGATTESPAQFAAAARPGGFTGLIAGLIFARHPVLNATILGLLILIVVAAGVAVARRRESPPGDLARQLMP